MAIESLRNIFFEKQQLVYLQTNSLDDIKIILDFKVLDTMTWQHQPLEFLVIEREYFFKMMGSWVDVDVLIIFGSIYM